MRWFHARTWCFLASAGVLAAVSNQAAGALAGLALLVYLTFLVTCITTRPTSS